MIKAILFDMDGVILDSHDAWFYIYNKALDKFEGKSIDMKEFDDCAWAKDFNEVCKKYFSVPVLDVRKYYREIYGDFKAKSKPMVNAKKALKILKDKGIRLAVASNTQKVVIEQILKDKGLEKYFDFLLGGDSVKNGKPAPDMVIKALGEFNLTKDEVVFVGDTIWDGMAASKAGVKFVGFKIEGDKRIEDLKELVELI